MPSHFVGSQLDFVGSLLDCVPWATANLCQEFQKWQKFGKTNIFLCSPFTSQNFYPFKSCLKNFQMQRIPNFLSFCLLRFSKIPSLTYHNWVISCDSDQLVCDRLSYFLFVVQNIIKNLFMGKIKGTKGCHWRPYHFLFLSNDHIFFFSDCRTKSQPKQKKIVNIWR